MNSLSYRCKICDLLHFLWDLCPKKMLPKFDGTRDKCNREYARFSDLKPGDLVQTDSGFTCRPAWLVSRVYAGNSNEDLCISCDENGHGLDGQLSWEEGEEDVLVGVYRVVVAG